MSPEELSRFSQTLDDADFKELIAGMHTSELACRQDRSNRPNEVILPADSARPMLPPIRNPSSSAPR
jgi:hypothetical protein